MPQQCGKYAFPAFFFFTRLRMIDVSTRDSTVVLVSQKERLVGLLSHVRQIREMVKCSGIT